MALLKKLPVAPLASAARAASTQVATASSDAASTQVTAVSSDATYSFVKARTAYRAEVAALRHEFIAEVARRKEKLARDAEAQRQKIMKEKAARMEIKRQQQAVRAQEVAREKALHEEQVRERFEAKAVVREARNAEVVRRRAALLETLREQTDTWITDANLAERLKEDVFIYSPHQISARAAFDPASTSGSAMSWLEKLQRMKPAGVKSTIAASEATATDNDKKSDA